MRALRIIFLSMALANVAIANTWQDLWVTKDNQAKAMMSKGQYKKAQETFIREDWRAYAAYRAGDYLASAKQYQMLNSEDGYYNQGNALAHMGRYEDAIKAYDKALTINPNNQDAAYNRALIEALLKKDKEQQNQDKQNQDKQNQDKQNQDKQNQDKQNQDKQNQDKQNQDKQNQDKQNQDKQNQDKQNQDKQNQDKKNQDKKLPDSALDNQASQDKKEKQQEKKQWLRLIPDDPGGLLREKFLRDFLRKQGGWTQ